MSQEILQQRIGEILAVVEDSLAQRRNLPALILLYTAIDIVGGLDRPTKKKDATRADFRAWVDEFLLPGSGLQCSSIDLYAARCGLLHTYSADSLLSRTGAAKQIFYAWGKSRVEDLATATERTSGWRGKAVTVHIDALASAFRAGFEKFLAAVAAEPARATRVYARAGKFFAPLSVDVVQAYLESTDPGRKP